MSELLTKMKKYADECKEQVKELDLEQIKVLKERFDVMVMRKIGVSLYYLNTEKQGIHWIGL